MTHFLKFGMNLGQNIVIVHTNVLDVGGMNKKNAKKNWVQVSNFCKEYFEN